jgi:general secretion pathway protein B
MSSILKALEKVEESQTKRSGGPSGLVRGRQRRSPWVIAGAVLGGAAVAALATFAAMGGFSRHAPSQAAQTVNPVPAVVVAPHPSPVPAVAPPKQAPLLALPVAAPTQRGTQNHAFAAPVKPASTVRKAAVPAAVKPAAAKAATAKVATVKAVSPAKPAAGKAKSATARPAPAKTVTAKPAKAANRKVTAKGPAKESTKATAKASAGKASTGIAKLKKAAAAQAATAARSTAHANPVASRPVAPLPAVPARPAPVAVARPQSEKTRAALRVTGIAWQNDSVSSVAMVNGRAVQQGATVDGYKVDQIYEDKVRFSSSNGRVEVPLGGGE